MSVNRNRKTKTKNKLGDITKFSNNRHLIFSRELRGVCCMKCHKRHNKYNPDVDYDYRSEERREVFDFYRSLEALNV